MFRWLLNIFHSAQDPFSSLPHCARVWLATETAALFTPIFQQQWTDAPDRYTRRLRWSQNALRKHITGTDERPRLVRLAVMQSMGVAGAAMRHGRDDVSHYATISRCAAQAAERGPDESQLCLDEILSYAGDCVDNLGRPELWARIEELAQSISLHAGQNDWDDNTKIPVQLIESLTATKET